MSDPGISDFESGRRHILAAIDEYLQANPQEKSIGQRLIQFINDDDNCFQRSNPHGHITASAWIIDPRSDKILLVHHRKLDAWLQCGGHADGDHDPARVALREAQEETGLKSLQFVTEMIFDIDIHPIPSQGSVQEHFHYDIRYLLAADANEQPTCSNETLAVKWLSAKELPKLTREYSVLRMAEKATGFLGRL